MNMEKQVVHLGSENGWGDTMPAILKDALGKGFKEVETYNNGRGYHRYKVETNDKILVWSCDSSD